jgi:predicted transcriptional regulator
MNKSIIEDLKLVMLNVALMIENLNIHKFLDYSTAEKINKGKIKFIVVLDLDDSNTFYNLDKKAKEFILNQKIETIECEFKPKN